MNNFKYLLGVCLLLVACSDDDENPAGAADSGVGGKTLTLSFSDLPELGPDFVYEGWLIDDSTPVSTGRFSVSGGNATPSSFSVDSAVADAAAVFVLTIEPAEGDDPAPAATHILAGAMAAGNATLTTDHPAALQTDFATAAGEYVLTAPTAGGTAEEQGIWFVKPAEGAPSLVLPTLPAGWVYEGWVVDANGPTSTGRFTDPAAADSDLAGSAKGPMGDGPPFPGQDFIDPAKILNDGATVVVISVEPEPDDGAAPFFIKPLVHDPIGAALAPTLQTMVNNAANTLPSGSVAITDSN
ncbi:MAG: anti-sigma factor [Kofleriaceae bacterium]|nr:anti-sigma factor [Kofleriaceae bacterium]